MFVHGSHDPWLLALSVAVAIFTALMALQTGYIAQATENRFYRYFAIATGAVALGGGIWTTHFIGMLAFELPAPVSYDTGLTLLSLLPACVASWFALQLLSRKQITWRLLLVSGGLVGLGICSMHYLGMAAMRTPLILVYEPWLFGLSVLASVVLATAALWLRYGLRSTNLSRAQRSGAAGLVLGLAIASMHYVAMAAARFIGEPGEPSLGLFLNATYASLALSSFTVTAMVMVVALNGLVRAHELYRRMEELYRRMEDGNSRLRATLETAVDGIITIDSKGLIRDFNRSAERLFGWRAEEVLGRNIKMLMPEPYQSAHDGYLANYLSSGQARIIGVGREVVGLRKDGSHMPMRLAVGRVELPGELLFVGFVTDISARHALESSLREAAQQAREAAAAKSTFLANMSHEIRTPMNSIIGFTDLLLQSDLSSVQRSHLNTVRQAARSLLRLLNDILDTTKLEKGRLQLEEADFSLKGLVMQIESSMRLAAQDKGLQLSVHYPDDMPEFFRGDALRILQVLNNLVGNAIKFTEQGQVKVAARYEKGQVQLGVSDTGIGMTPKQVASLFQPFSQADASISRRFGGTGLGTTIARQLIELMGGQIAVRSVFGEGSTFEVSLPLPRGQRPRSEGGEGLPQLPPLRILVADDVPQNLELLTLTLEGAGHKVEAASNGSEAVEAFMSGHFDLVLMDVHMPLVDGLQATRLIRQFERQTERKMTPVIALTASVMAEDKAAARAAGMDGFASKPLELRELCVEMARVLGLELGAEVCEAKPLVEQQGGVNWEQGVALWGNQERLQNALQSFLSTQEERYPLVLPPQGEPDWEGLRFSLHGIRGAAGNLAIPRVAELAAQLEEVVRQRAEEALRARLPLLREQLNEVRQALALSAEPSDLQQAQLLMDMDAHQLNERLQALMAVVRQHELDDDLLHEVDQMLLAQGLHEVVMNLRRALEGFDFEAAQVQLQSVLEQVSVDAESDGVLNEK